MVDFHQIYLQFSTDSCLKVKITVAKSLHEAFKVTGEDDDTSALRQALHELLESDNPEIMFALSQNLDTIIAKYANEQTK